MRKFGTDAPEFFSFQIGESKKVYKLPLAASLPHKHTEALREAEANETSYDFWIGFLREHMGDVVDELTEQTLADILKAWDEKSNKQGASVGES